MRRADVGELPGHFIPRAGRGIALGAERLGVGAGPRARLRQHGGKLGDFGGEPFIPRDVRLHLMQVRLARLGQLPAEFIPRMGRLIAQVRERGDGLLRRLAQVGELRHGAVPLGDRRVALLAAHFALREKVPALRGVGLEFAPMLAARGGEGLDFPSVTFPQTGRLRRHGVALCREFRQRRVRRLRLLPVMLARLRELLDETVLHLNQILAAVRRRRHLAGVGVVCAGEFLVDGFNASGQLIALAAQRGDFFGKFRAFRFQPFREGVALLRQSVDLLPQRGHQLGARLFLQLEVGLQTIELLAPPIALLGAEGDLPRVGLRRIGQPLLRLVFLPRQPIPLRGENFLVVGVLHRGPRGVFGERFSRE